ncbi:hypothetical protein GCM10023340_38880 [Nocardioides marinquilinus]|uniref:Uncharacterized protein n=2 Tax=Nocardioides marinquilinus TaxID=1210400 RepID=A0ABP9Q025_9ACTN
MPKSVASPCAFVGPGSPYITGTGANFGCEIVRHVVTVVAGTADGDSREDELDDLIARVLPVLEALRAQGFVIGDVRGPGVIGINGKPYLAAPIDVLIEHAHGRDD